MVTTNTYIGSRKQKEIMRLLTAAVCSGQEIWAGELKSKLSYGGSISKQALYCSLKFLEKHGLLTKKMRAGKAMLIPTARGMALYAPRPDPEPSSDK